MTRLWLWGPLALFAVFVVNGIAAAIPATLFLFFAKDGVGLGQYAGLFLMLYFAAAALSLPLWVALARRYGEAATWMAAMLLAVCARLHSTSGGSSETELKELMVTPSRAPSPWRAVITVTPVANWDRAWRNCLVSNSGAEPHAVRADMGSLHAWVEFNPY